MDLSTIFDAGYYAGVNPDLSAAGLTNSDQLLNHFQQYGVKEGRSFSPYIDLNYYNSANPDLAATGLTNGDQLLYHLLNHGINEKRKFAANVDLNYYGAVNSDLAAAGLTKGEELLWHIVNYGGKEGRQLIEPALPLNDFNQITDISPSSTPPDISDILGSFSPPGIPDFGALSLPQLRTLPTAELNGVLAAGLETSFEQLNSFLTSPLFSSHLKTAFGESIDLDAAKALIESLVSRQGVPQFEIVSTADINSSLGAFDALTNTVYISQEFLSQNANNPAVIAGVVLEEIGHFIDSRINILDAAGDEGAIFSALVEGKAISDSELQGLKAENDVATIALNGTNVTLEQNKSAYLWTWDSNGKYLNGGNSTLINVFKNNGIDLNWGQSTADAFNNPYLGDGPKDYFGGAVAIGANFEQGRTYKFNASADDYLRIAVQSNQNSNDTTWLTPNWLQLGGSGKTELTFTPKSTGFYWIWAYMYELTGDASLSVTWQETTSKSNGEKSNLNLYRVDGRPADIQNRPTWVVIHGMNDYTTNPESSVKPLAENLGNKRQDDQVLVLDWKEAASGRFSLPESNRGGSWITTVAKWAANKLKNEWGISPNNINIAGHSLGSYLGWEIAKNIGEVNRLIALDPATTTLGGYENFNSVDFSKYSKWAWGFYGSPLGNDQKAKTAEESFKVIFPSLNPDAAHGGVATTFANMVKLGDSDSISRYFNVDQMGSQWYKPWGRVNGFEASIGVKNSNQGWVPALLEPTIKLAS